jgi:hypothetical protein
VLGRDLDSVGVETVVIARVAVPPSSCGHGRSLGAIAFQPFSPVRGSPPSHVRVFDVFRPARASWMPGTLPRSLIVDVTSARASVWSSLQIPRSWGVTRPQAPTAVASVMTAPAPPTARLVGRVSCQSIGRLSRLSQEY